MKIGVMAYRQLPYISANTAIAYIIGEEISKSHTVVYIGRKQDECQEEVHEYHNNKICFFNKKLKSDYLRLKEYLVRIGLVRLAYNHDAIELRKIIKSESIDALICVIAPNEDAFIAMSANLKIPVYLYQLDPFYNLYDIESNRLKRLFMKYLKQVHHVFTTPLLMDIYKSDFSFEQYQEKLSAVQFPKLIKPSKNCIHKQERTVLLYSGNLYANRKSEYLIELVKCLPKEYDLIFCGKCEYEDDNHKLEQNGVICKGYCSQDELQQEMNNADIFINIGNAVMNQLPSKVIDYIATGKPIINLSQIDGCTSRRVLAKYRYFIDIQVNHIAENKEKVNQFILQTKEKRIPWDDIKKTYYEYLPEVVANHILQQIEMVNK